MDATQKLEEMATQMHLEPAEETAVTVGPAPCGVTIPQTREESRRVKINKSLGVFDAVVSGGKTIPLLKTLLTSACERDCHYCPFRAGRNYRRTTFKPEEMAKTFSEMHQAKLVNGLFLSSGIIKGGVRTQDKLIDTVDILRHKHNFRGYVHLKIMPGAEKDQIARAMQLADRLSINLEASTSAHLNFLAPKKQLEEELIRPLRWVEEMRRSQPRRKGWNGRWPSTTTQFVVGAGDDSDVDYLTITEHLYKRLRLQRAYYSAFRPIKDTPLENLPAAPLMRQNRLYQASFLLRDYGFDMESLPFDEAGRLPLDRDPKQAWADFHLAHAPVEVNKASHGELLQVPGIGPKSAAAIVKARRQGAIRSEADLKAIGVRPQPLLPYVLLNGKRPWRQLSLFLS